MNSIETQIYQIISASNGIKGSDIAVKIGIEKKMVNSILANSVALKAVVFQDENYRWYTRTKSSSASSNRAASVPIPDKDLRNLCNYYLNCLALEASSSVSQFLTSRYSLQYAVLNGLEINDDCDIDAKNLLRQISSNRDTKAFSNEEFYDGTLRTATRYSSLKPPTGEKPGIRWIDIRGETKRPRYAGLSLNMQSDLQKCIRMGKGVAIRCIPREL